MSEKPVKKADKKKDAGFWERGYFAETMSSDDSKKRMRTFHMKHDEEMNFSCKRCGARISAHNRDWHAGMCDKCSFEAISGKRQRSGRD